ncbi:MAG: hypothetical protein JXB23_11820 [Candidatus Aminicenantes bacterium]|nr:hypothetical protein [Candidatus Aminicenantes bacterium]
MHYWSPQEKKNFLLSIKDLKNGTGKTYKVKEINGARLCLPSDEGNKASVIVISLIPAPFANPTFYQK